MRLFSQVRGPALAAFCVLPLLIILSGGCKIDQKVLQAETIAEMDAKELMYFEEYLDPLPSGESLGEAAREAARRSHSHILRYLKARGADLNRADSRGWTPILYAAEQGDLDTVRYLVEKLGCDVRSRNPQRVGPLMLAAQAGNPELCRYLLTRGVNVNARSQAGFTPLMYAAANGRKEAIRILLASGADPRLRDAAGRIAADHALDSATAALLNSGLPSPGGEGE